MKSEMIMSQMLHDETASIPAEPTVEDDFRWIFERYDIISAAPLEHASHKIETNLGAGEPRFCRYCHKGAPLVSFAQEAHALPGLIGNQWLFDLLECDECNALFGKTIDAHFGRWSLSWRTLERTPNRESASPQYQAHDEASQIESDDPNKMTIVEGMSKGGRYTIDSEARTVEFKLTRRGFAPSSVFKCLVKMAIAVAPPEYSESLKHLKPWIRGDVELSEPFTDVPLVLSTQLLPTLLAPGKFDFGLLRRKPMASADSPYLFFHLRFGGRAYQIGLPLLAEDADQSRDNPPKLPMFPGVAESFIDFTRPAAPIERHDMSSSNFKDGEDIVLRYGFGTIQEQDPSQFQLLTLRSDKRQ